MLPNREPCFATRGRRRRSFRPDGAPGWPKMKMTEACRCLLLSYGDARRAGFNYFCNTCPTTPKDVRGQRQLERCAPWYPSLHFCNFAKKATSQLPEGASEPELLMEWQLQSTYDWRLPRRLEKGDLMRCNHWKLVGVSEHSEVKSQLLLTAITLIDR